MSMVAGFYGGDSLVTAPGLLLVRQLLKTKTPLKGVFVKSCQTGNRPAFSNSLWS